MMQGSITGIVKETLNKLERDTNTIMTGSLRFRLLNLPLILLLVPTG